MISTLKKGFTLIEVIITVAVIVALALIAVPAMENYGKNNRFDDRAAEIEFLVSQTLIKAKNPEKDIESYRLVPDAANRTIRLINSQAQVVNQVDLDTDESVAARYNLECFPPGRICQLRDAANAVIVPTAAAVILTYYDNRINKNASYLIVPDPWRITVQK